MRHHQPDRLGAERVGQGLGVRRIDALDRVVEGPHPSRNPKPVRRVEAELRIVDDGAMLEARIGHDALDAGCLVGDPAAGRELAGRERGGHGDELDLPARAAGPARAVEINLACHQGHVATVEQRGRGHLAGVDRAAAAERDQRIGADPLGLGHEGPHRTSGTCCPTPANTPAQCGPIAAATRSRSGEAPKVLPVATSARVAPIRSSSAPSVVILPGPNAIRSSRVKVNSKFVALTPTVLVATALKVVVMALSLFIPRIRCDHGAGPSDDDRRPAHVRHFPRSP